MDVASGVSRMRPGAVTALLTTLLLVAVQALSCGVASAHDNLVAATPADNSHVAERPARVVLVFDEGVAALGTSIVVVAPSGAVVSTGDTTVDGTTATVALRSDPGAQNGGYAVRYRIVSADGHEVEGNYAFRVGVGGSTAPDAVTGSGGDDGSDVAVLLSGLGVLVGLVLIGVAVAQGRHRRHARPTDPGRGMSRPSRGVDQGDASTPT